MQAVSRTMPGLDSGNQAKSAPGIIAVLVPDTAGDITIRTMQLINPRTCSRARRGC